jgi:hypothetical protein
MAKTIAELSANEKLEEVESNLRIIQGITGCSSSRVI